MGKLKGKAVKGIDLDAQLSAIHSASEQIKNGKLTLADKIVAVQNFAEHLVAVSSQTEFNELSESGKGAILLADCEQLVSFVFDYMNFDFKAGETIQFTDCLSKIASVVDCLNGFVKPLASAGAGSPSNAFGQVTPLCIKFAMAQRYFTQTIQFIDLHKVDGSIEKKSLEAMLQKDLLDFSSIFFGSDQASGIEVLNSCTEALVKCVDDLDEEDSFGDHFCDQVALKYYPVLIRAIDSYIASNATISDSHLKRLHFLKNYYEENLDRATSNDDAKRHSPESIVSPAPPAKRVRVAESLPAAGSGASASQSLDSSELLRLQAVVAEKDKLIADQVAQLAKKDEALQAAQQMQLSLQKEKEELAASLSEKSGIINKLEEQLRETTAGLSAQLEKLSRMHKVERQSKTLLQVIQQQQQLVLVLKERHQVLIAQIKELTQQQKEAMEQLSIEFLETLKPQQQHTDDLLKQMVKKAKAEQLQITGLQEDLTAIRIEYQAKMQKLKVAQNKLQEASVQLEAFKVERSGYRATCTKLLEQPRKAEIKMQRLRAERDSLDEKLKNVLLRERSVIEAAAKSNAFHLGQSGGDVAAAFFSGDSGGAGAGVSPFAVPVEESASLSRL